MAGPRSCGESSRSSTTCSYDVFLSFRGQDTRKNFTGHLYAALVQAGFHTFRDDDGIGRGENIESEIQKAIQQSQLSIVVFSKSFASSRWCLDELVQIMEQRKISGHAVLPVFYDVNPSEVRKQCGACAEAFNRHEWCLKEEPDKVQRWREALRVAADLAGMVLENRLESEFIQSIVKTVGNKLDRVVLNVTQYLVGRENLVIEINKWLLDRSREVSIVTIFGVGGIGKTTVAKIVYNLNFRHFEGSSFLANVRETSLQFDGLISLQKKFLSDLLKTKQVKIDNIDEGITKIKAAVCCKRVLIVLDDLDDLNQYNTIIGMREWFNPGSKIIVTTRHEQLLKSHDISKKIKVDELGHVESLKLLNLHAFGEDWSREGHAECSEKIVKHCGGLPLALQVLGSSLSGRNKDVWEDTAKKLEMIPDSKIQQKLRISYDSLQDDHDRSLFLDIACFFVGKTKDDAVSILEGCGFYATVGIQNLIDRCLISIDQRNKITMHPLVKAMGREIARQHSPDDLGKRTRLWHDKDAVNVLIENIGSETVKGLTLDLRRLKQNNPGSNLPYVNHLKRGYDGDSHESSGLHDQESCWKRRCLGFFSWKPVATSSISELKTDAFRRMRKLQLLQLNYVSLTGSYEGFPKSLVWLCWHRFPLKSLPTSLNLEKLVVLDMRYSSLKIAWKKIQFLPELKVLDLSHSQSLLRTPNLLGLPKLEKLLLKDCIKLVEVDGSIGSLSQLFHLNLKDCKSLKKLPRTIGMLKSLEELILSGCSELEELPEGVESMKSLKVLRADRTGISQLQSTTKFWRSISRILVPQRSQQAPGFPMVCLPSSLMSLNLSYCNISDRIIPGDFSNLPSLKYLNLSGNPISNLPKNFNSLMMLHSLIIERCKELRFLPELPMSLVVLSAAECSSLERVTNVPNEHEIFDTLMYGCKKLTEIPGVFKLESILEVQKEALDALGLSGTKALDSTEVMMYNSFTIERRAGPLQVLCEFGIINIFLAECEVPCCFSSYDADSAICVCVDPPAGEVIHSLNLYVVYEPWDDSYVSPHLSIKNRSKGLEWVYTPTCWGISEENEDMLWLSHWKFQDQMEVGDVVEVSLDMPDFELKKWGIHVAYKPEEKMMQENIEESLPCVSSLNRQLALNHIDLLKYQTETGRYRLSHPWIGNEVYHNLGNEQLGRRLLSNLFSA